MTFSPHTLHSTVIQSEEHKAEARRKFAAIAERLKAKREASTAAATTKRLFAIPLTAVSYSGNFDAYIHIQFQDSSMTHLLVDSGNATLIVPHWEAIENLSGYTVLGTTTEPWGCPANVVQGPILIPDSTGGVYTIDNCVFYACTGNNRYGPRTANFGAGCPTPWSANPWNVRPGVHVIMQAPLSYNTEFPYAEFLYAPASEMFSDSGELNVSDKSLLVIHRTAPAGYTMLNTIHHLAWMSVIPRSLSIGNTETQWPGTVPSGVSPIAMVDTGGGPVFLSDPNGYVHKTQWPDRVICPAWTSTSRHCKCIRDEIELVLEDATNSFAYTINTSRLPPSVQGLTAVMCEMNRFMMNQQGMNIGGISALFNSILIDYRRPQVGFKPRQPATDLVAVDVVQAS
jgi:hypothetical protein